MYVGGLRARLIKDNFVNYITDGLQELGWLDSGRQHREVRIISTEIDDDQELNPNIVSIVEEDVFSLPSEMGSNLSEHRWTYFIDIYAESHAVGLHLSTDIRDLLQGRFSSIGIDSEYFVVYDLTQATPSELFSCEITNINLDRSRIYTRKHEKYWWVIGLNINDEYSNEDD